MKSAARPFGRAALFVVSMVGADGYGVMTVVLVIGSGVGVGEGMTTPPGTLR